MQSYADTMSQLESVNSQLDSVDQQIQSVQNESYDTSSTEPEGMTEEEIKQKMKENSEAWWKTDSQEEKDRLHKENLYLNSLLETPGKYYNGQYYYGTDKYASGTKNANGGLSVVGENGPELRVLNRGDGIIPSALTSNLMKWGKFSPDKWPREWFGRLQPVINPSSTMSSNNFNISNLTLPNIS